MTKVETNVTEKDCVGFFSMKEIMDDIAKVQSQVCSRTSVKNCKMGIWIDFFLKAIESIGIELVYISFSNQ